REPSNRPGCQPDPEPDPRRGRSDAQDRQGSPCRKEGIPTRISTPHLHHQMKASILATNPSARCWLKWLAGQIDNQKVTECLKIRVKSIITEKSEGGIC